MSLGPWEIVLVVLVIIILFGGKKIPELARGLGKGLQEFRLHNLIILQLEVFIAI